MLSRWNTIGIDSYFSGLSPLVFPEFELFSSVTTIGSVSTTINSGFANKQIKITLPAGITTVRHKIFTTSNFYVQNRIVISAKEVNSENGFYGVTTLSEIIFTAKTFTNLKGYNLLHNCTANVIFPNATAVPPAANAMGTFKGYAYVPDSLVSAWKAVSGWSNISSRIKPLSEWTTE